MGILIIDNREPVNLIVILGFALRRATLRVRSKQDALADFGIALALTRKG